MANAIPLDQRLPRFEFIYRLKCVMANNTTVIDRGTDGSAQRLVLPISSGTVDGPRVSGIILQDSGADWAESYYNGEFMKLNARYTLRTHDGHNIYVRSRGIYAPEPGLEKDPKGPPRSITQDQADWFTRLQFEAGVGPYSWMNHLFAIGVLTMQDSNIMIDAYRVTNFPGREARPIQTIMYASRP